MDNLRTPSYLPRPVSTRDLVRRQAVQQIRLAEEQQRGRYARMLALQQRFAKDPQIHVNYFTWSQEATNMIRIEQDNGVRGKNLSAAIGDWCDLDQFGYVAKKACDPSQEDYTMLASWLLRLRERHPDGDHTTDADGNILDPMTVARQELDTLKTGETIAGLLWRERGVHREILRMPVQGSFKEWQKDIRLQLVDYLQMNIASKSSNHAGAVYFLQSPNDPIADALRQSDFRDADAEDLDVLRSHGTLDRNILTFPRPLLLWQKWWESRLRKTA